MKVTLPASKAVKTALDNFRAKELDKIFRLKLKLQASEPFKTLDVTSHLDMQAQVIEQADHTQLAQMYLQKNLLDEYETFTNDPQFILGTNVEATLLIYKKGSNEYVQPTYYNTVKHLHDDLIHTVDEHYSDFTQGQYTVYEAALEGIELALRNIDTLPHEYSQTFKFESTTHRYEVSFFNPF